MFVLAKSELVGTFQPKSRINNGEIKKFEQCD